MATPAAVNEAKYIVFFINMSWMRETNIYFKCLNFIHDNYDSVWLGDRLYENYI